MYEKLRRNRDKVIWAISNRFIIIRFFSLKSTHPKRDLVQLIIILAYLIERWFGLRSHVTSNALLEDVNNSYASTIYRVRDVALSAFIDYNSSGQNQGILLPQSL